MRKASIENSKLGCQPARHHRAVASASIRAICCRTSAQAPAPDAAAVMPTALPTSSAAQLRSSMLRKRIPRMNTAWLVEPIE